MFGAFCQMHIADGLHSLTGSVIREGLTSVDVTLLARLFHERMFARRLILWSHVANASSNICNPVSTKNTNLKPLAAETVVAAQDGAPIGTIASITGEICALAWLHEDEMMCNFQLNCLNWLQPPSRCRVICCYLSWETESPQKLEVYFLQH